VRGLEEKVRGLETQLASVMDTTRDTATSYRAQSHDSGSHNNNDTNSGNNAANYVEPQLLDLTVGPQRNIDPALFPATEVGPVNLAPDFISSPGNTPSSSLVEELKLLSLEATAERHLGFTSGLSFARLTQMILQRLSPDKAEFVFGNNQPLETQGDQHPTIIPDALNSMIHGFNDSLTAYPTLFGDFSLSDITDSPDVLGTLRFPEQAHLQHLVDFYFAHSHTLYPIINRTEFNSALEQIYSNPQDPLAQSSLWLFRIWIVLAIGSTTYCSVSLAEESEPMLYYNKAMQYFENALGYGDMVC
jgi:hypothetical protein